MRIPEPRIRPLKLAIALLAGLTTSCAIAVATGISEDEARRLIAGEFKPTDEIPAMRAMIKRAGLKLVVV